MGTKYNLIWRLHVNTLIHNIKMSLTLILFWPSPQNPITSAFGSGLFIRKFWGDGTEARNGFEVVNEETLVKVLDLGCISSHPNLAIWTMFYLSFKKLTICQSNATPLAYDHRISQSGDKVSSIAMARYQVKCHLILIPLPTTTQYPDWVVKQSKSNDNWLCGLF